MNIKKPLLIVGAMSGIALASLAGAGIVSAAPDSTNGPSGLIDKLVQKFNLNKDEVKAVFDQEHTARQAERQKSIEDRLDQAVTDKKLTSEQKDKILAKLAELRTEHEAEHESMKDKTKEERRDAMKEHRDELKKWAEDNDIPIEYLRFVGGHKGPGGHRFMDKSED